jgi:hypothetical protein
MSMRRLVLALVLGLLVSAPAAAAVKGVVAVTATRGPVTPVCKVGQPCDGPAEGVQLVVRRSDTVVKRAVTNAVGSARLVLAPGRYQVTAFYGAAMHARLQARSVVVVGGRTTRLRFSFDTGIR